MTHEELRKRAMKWLTGTCHCSVVLSEMACWNAGNEIPDAIGWKNSHSILVEVKVSRSDFAANKKKFHSQVGRGMGQERFFLSPPHVIQPEDLYEGYGLLWAVDNQRIRSVVPATRRTEFNQEGERAMLVSALRRVKTREFLTIVSEAPATDPNEAAA